MTTPQGGEVQIVVQGDHLLLDGTRSDVDHLLERLTMPVERTRIGIATGAMELGSAAATAGALASTTRELYELTPAAQALIANFGWATNGAGDLAGVVRNGGSSIAGHLSLDKVSMGAEQAMALQTAAVAIALRSAIADVKKAVEEVDEKVEDLQQRIRAEEIGEVVGLYRDLEHVVERTQRIGQLLDADWDSIDSARRDLSVALEKMRAYVTGTVRSTAATADLPARVKAVKRVGSAKSVGGTLQLIAVAEHALHLWHYLYIERVRTTDPQHVQEAIASSRTVLEEHRRLDEALVTLLIARVVELADVRPLEIHRRGSIREMDRRLQAAHESIETFAGRTRTQLPNLGGEQAARPGLPEARAEVKARALGARDVGVEISRDVAERMKQRTAEQMKRIKGDR
jgi:hypothetical protein